MAGHTRSNKAFSEPAAHKFASHSFCLFLPTQEVNHRGQPLPDAGGAGVDDDIVEHGSGVVTEHDVTCKLSLELFVQPMKNTVCSHSYEKESILQHMLARQSSSDRVARPRTDLRPNFSCPCPIAGCNHAVSRETLVEDRAMIRRVNEFKRLRAAQGGVIRVSRKRGGGTIKEEDLTQQPDQDQQAEDSTTNDNSSVKTEAIAARRRRLS